MPQHRQPTFRCIEDDLGYTRPPLRQLLCQLIGDDETDPARKLVKDFCHDSESAEQGKRIAEASDAAGVPIFRRRQSGTRGLTWYDREAADKLPDGGMLAIDSDEPGIEWMLHVGARKADAVYAEGVKLARIGKLLPVEDDYLRAHAEFATYLALRLPSAVAQLLGAARNQPGEVLALQIAWGIPAHVLIEYDAQVEEIRIALPRSAGAFVDRVELALLALLDRESGLAHEEVLHPHLMPRWVPQGWRCFHFVHEPN